MKLILCGKLRGELQSQSHTPQLVISLFFYLLVVLDGVPATSIQRARLVWRLRRPELVANYVVEASVPTIILFCVIRKDVDNLITWQTFRPKGLHQSQISHELVQNFRHLCRKCTFRVLQEDSM